MRNTFGNLFTLTTFGESHGIAVGGVIDGFPAGIDIDMDFIQSELNRRRPGQSHITTTRKEADQVEFLSGVFEGKSTEPLSALRCATRTSILGIMRICAVCSVHPMPTSLTMRSMASVIIAVAAVHLHASPSPAA